MSVELEESGHENRGKYAIGATAATIILIILLCGPGRARTDEEIAVAVEAELREDQAVPFTVSVEDGVVTLRGTVDSLYARRHAAEEARLTIGVSRVRDNLKAGFGEAIDDP